MIAAILRLPITAAALALALAGGALAQDKTATAIFAGGCFWCLESDFDKVPGVVATTSGYSGGTNDNPTYEQVSAGTTGHKETLKVTYDPAKVGYARLLEVFWHNVDPFDARGQFCDKGSQYTAAIFVANEEERKLAEHSKGKVSAGLGKPVVTEILPEKTFYPAEDYHQDYYKKNPARYKFYRWNCGRDKRLEEVWGEAAHS